MLIKKDLTIANFLSALRLFLVPVLLILAWFGAAHWFLACLILSLLTDIADGKIARWLNQTSELGSILDSWSDFATYSAVPFCAFWLRPDFVSHEKYFFLLVVLSYGCPVLIGFIKYRRLTSYHTRGAVIAAYCLGAATVIVFANGPFQPFRLAAIVLMLAELEEIAITIVMPHWQANIRSLSVALALRQQLTKKAIVSK